MFLLNCMSPLVAQSGHAPVLSLKDRINHPPHSIARCRELIAVAVSQIDGDPIVGDRLVDPALEITVAHFKKIIALQRAGRRNPMTHKRRGFDANVHIGKSVMHRSTIGFARHRSYARTATVDKIAQPMGNLLGCKCPLMTQSEGKELPLTFDVICNKDGPSKTNRRKRNADLEHFTGSRCCSCVDFDVFSNTRGLKEKSWRDIRPTALCEHNRYCSPVI